MALRPSVRLTGVVLALLGVVLAACGDQDPVASEPDAVELDGSWVLVSGTDADGELPILPSHPVTLQVDGDRASGTSACNQYGGTVDRSDDTVAFQGMAGTEMACDPMTVMDLEQRYLAAVQAVDTATRDGDRLELSGDGVTLVFEPQPPVEQADLVGTTWRLESLVSGAGSDGTVSSVVGRPTLRLSDDGTFTASTGCREFEGTWTESGAELTFDGPDMVTLGCPDGTVAQDAHILAVLGGRVTSEIAADRLTLDAPDGRGLAYRAG